MNNPKRHCLLLTLVLAAASATACGGAATSEGSGGASDTNGDHTGGGANGGTSTGGSSAAATGEGSAPESTRVGKSIHDALSCPPEQWVCPNEHPCAGWSNEPSDCYCDPNAPLEASECGPDEDFSCTLAEYDPSTERELPTPLRWACQCDPRTDSCCDSARWSHTYGVIPISGCVDEPGPREVVCDCTSYIR